MLNNTLYLHLSIVHAHASMCYAHTHCALNAAGLSYKLFCATACAARGLRGSLIVCSYLACIAPLPSCKHSWKNYFSSGNQNFPEIFLNFVEPPNFFLAECTQRLFMANF